MLDPLLVLAGLALLVLGGDQLVAGATRLARRLGVSPLWIGLTVVAFGTSMPEMVVSLLANLRGQGAIALGNVVGSNIANATLILGAAALVRPVGVQRAVVRREVPLLIGVSLLLVGLLADRRLGTLEGLVLLLVLVAWTAWGYRALRAAPPLPTDAELPDAPPIASASNPPGAVPTTPDPSVPEDVAPLLGDREALALTLLRLLAGLALLVVGAELLVRGATALARGWGVSETVIGLSIVAVGTSLPELATSLVAARRGAGDVAIGNVVGSNVFNVAGILGVSATVRPVADPMLSWLDLGVLLGTAVLLWPLARTGHRIDRGEATVLLLLYAAYLGWRTLA